MENRAAVFANKPQAVEVYQAGAWWSGELLGWRHAADGSCQVWVRVVLDGVEETAWTDLETLRLPERHLAMAPDAASVRSGDRELSVARHPSSRREHRAVGDSAPATASLPAVRDLSVVLDAGAAPAGGRRRAPEVPIAAQSGGRRRAPEEPAPASAGGRRRATEPPATAGGLGRRRAPDETVAGSTAGRRRAPEDAASTAGPAALLGRHGVVSPASAAGNPGRHRTADTGLFPAVPAGTASMGDIGRTSVPMTVDRVPAVLSTRPAKPLSTDGGDPTGSWSVPGGHEPERLTRPMRLSDQLPHHRRPRADGSRPRT